jgi:hypothetical protein
MVFPKITRRKIFALINGSAILAAVTSRAEQNVCAPQGLLMDPKVKPPSTTGQQQAMPPTSNIPTHGGMGAALYPQTSAESAA